MNTIAKISTQDLVPLTRELTKKLYAEAYAKKREEYLDRVTPLETNTGTRCIRIWD